MRISPIIHWIITFINPLLKKPIQFHTAAGFTEITKLLGSSSLEGKSWIIWVIMHDLKKNRISYHMPQHMKDPHSFDVYSPGKNGPGIRNIMAINWRNK